MNRNQFLLPFFNLGGIFAVLLDQHGVLKGDSNNTNNMLAMCVAL